MVLLLFLVFTVLFFFFFMFLVVVLCFYHGFGAQELETTAKTKTKHEFLYFRDGLNIKIVLTLLVVARFS